MEDLSGSNIEVQPVLIEDMSFLSGADRIPNSTSDNIESYFLALLFIFVLADLFFKIRKKKREGQKYWKLNLLLIFLSLLFVLWIVFEVI